VLWLAVLAAASAALLAALRLRPGSTPQRPV
jgi:hypothetical protein